MCPELAELLLYLSNIYEGLASHSLNIRYICTAHCKNAGTMLKLHSYDVYTRFERYFMRWRVMPGPVLPKRAYIVNCRLWISVSVHFLSHDDAIFIKAATATATTRRRPRPTAFTSSTNVLTCIHILRGIRYAKINAWCDEGTT